jgi:signal transduction histidine kinase
VIASDEGRRRAAVEACRRAGLETASGDVLAALGDLERAAPRDAVVLDLDGWRDEGLDLIERFERGATPVIAVVAEGDAAVARTAVLRGASDFVSGAAGLAELATRVETAVRERRETRRRDAREGELRKELETERRLKALGWIAATTAHDLNNLLTIILAAVDILSLDPLPVSAPHRENVQRIKLAAERAAEMTNAILEFVKAGERGPAAPLVLDDAIRRSLGLLRRVAGGAISLETELKASHLRIAADAAGLDQVLLNLIVNARDAMSQGGTIRIETSEVHETEGAGEGTKSEVFVALRVRDTGVGMSPQVMARLFEWGFTTKREKGTGIGLPLVHAIVEEHHGRIRVESQPGRHTCFTILLPVVASGS